jgi:MFS family permease
MGAYFSKDGRCPSLLPIRWQHSHMNSSKAGTARPRIPRTIWMLGFVSLFTDMSSEIVHSLLPILLAGGLGASAVVIGLIEGAAEALVMVTKVFSGYISDAIGKRKPLVLFGYGLAALTKPIFPIADSIWLLTTARMLDRFGKGIRGAPRDAMVSELSPAEIRGASFGLRQSMDTVGAVLGPLLAVYLLWLTTNNIKLVLWVAVIPGLIAVLLLFTAVPEPGNPNQKPARMPISREGLAQLGKPFWRVVIIGVVISLARFSEAFLILRASNLKVPLTYIPLVLVVMSLIYALSAYPAGKLSDRMPRHYLLALGMLMLMLSCIVLAIANNYWLLFSGIALWGLHMGFSQGILASMVADTANESYRGTAFGVFNLVSGLGLLLASTIAGILWEYINPSATFVFGASVSILSVVLIMRFSPRLN